MNKREHFLWIIPIGDLIVINLVILLSIYVRSNRLSFVPPTFDIRSNLVLHIVSSIVFMSLFYILELYDKKRFSLSRILFATTIGFVIMNLLMFYNKDYAFSRLFLIYSYIFNTIFLWLFRIGFKIVIKRIFGERLLAKNVLIVGVNEKGMSIFDELKKMPQSEYNVIGFVATDEKETISKLPNSDTNNTPNIIGNLNELPELTKRENINDVIIAEHNIPYDKLMELISNCPDNVVFKAIPDTYEVAIGKTFLDELNGIPYIELMFEPVYGFNKTAKRFLDIIISFILLIFLSPVILLFAILVKIDSKGPAFYKQDRVGKGGRIFTLYKLRSMVENAEEETGPIWAKEDDPRITRIGKFIRKFSIDELPQLFCVLKGDMSLVGPRPERPFFIKQYKELQAPRLKVKPGLTGLAQINGRYNLTLEEKIRYDIYYIRNYSIWLDIEILLKTVVIAICGKGAR